MDDKEKLLLERRYERRKKWWEEEEEEEEDFFKTLEKFVKTAKYPQIDTLYKEIEGIITRYNSFIVSLITKAEKIVKDLKKKERFLIGKEVLFDYIDEPELFEAYLLRPLEEAITLFDRDRVDEGVKILETLGMNVKEWEKYTTPEKIKKLKKELIKGLKKESGESSPEETLASSKKIEKLSEQLGIFKKGYKDSDFIKELNKIFIDIEKFVSSEMKRIRDLIHFVRGKTIAYEDVKIRESDKGTILKYLDEARIYLESYDLKNSILYLSAVLEFLGAIEDLIKREKYDIYTIHIIFDKKTEKFDLKIVKRYETPPEFEEEEEEKEEKAEKEEKGTERLMRMLRRRKT